MKIGVFCSANGNIDAAYHRAAEAFGQWMAQKGHKLVFGGCNLGLMEVLAKAVHEGGGMTIGVVPSIIEKNGRVSDYVDVNIACDNLSDRKDLMMAQSDIFVALPGGIGTIDEIFTVAASRTIGYHNKRVILLNINGFWDKMIALLEDLQQQGFIRGNRNELIEIANNLEQIEELLEKAF